MEGYERRAKETTGGLRRARRAAHAKRKWPRTEALVARLLSLEAAHLLLEAKVEALERRPAQRCA